MTNAIYNERSCWENECHAHTQEQKVLGVVDVTIPLEPLDEWIRSSQIRMLVFAVIAIVSISTIVWVFVKIYILKQVNVLVDGTRKVAAGDFSHTIPASTRDELGYLAQSFNQMTRRLTEAQNQLYHADKLASLRRMAAGVAHEINNPLTGVLAYSSFILKRVENNEEMAKNIGVIVQETKRCREIVRGLLDFGRQTPPRRKSVDANTIIEQAVSVVGNQLSLDNVQIAKHLQPDLPLIFADANQIQQVFVNLLVNGADAMNNGGTLTVTSRLKNVAGAQPGGETGGVIDTGMIQMGVEIAIMDTGVGIPTENLPKIFEPFFTTKGGKGTGLGLAISWGIAQRHGGTITVVSEENEGTSFVVTLPVGGESLGNRDSQEAGDESV